MIRAGVVGNPIGHSLSPAIQNAWIAAANLDAEYDAFVGPLDGFADFIGGLQERGLRGVNVTIPFKEEALALADEASELAKLAGAANLLVFEDGRVRADNTDGPGLLVALKDRAGFDPTSGPAVILGAGGAARGAAAALVLAGSPQVRIVNRTRERAHALAASVGEHVIDYHSAEDAFEGAAVIINATSLGLGGGEGPNAPFEHAPGSAVVMDMVYKPLITQFLDAAAERGHPTVDGLEMLIGQARPSFEALFGIAPPLEVDARAVAVEAMA
ncbi:MAG TPA: shikimate dehydrogenase [Caulobacteraceae bacterium]